jgi:hypothetical protein
MVCRMIVLGMLLIRPGFPVIVCADEPGRVDTILVDLLHTVGLELSDLSIDGQRLADPDRMPTTIRFLDAPFAAPAFIDSLMQDVRSPSVPEALSIGTTLLHLPPKVQYRARSDDPVDLPPVLAVLTPLLSEVSAVKGLVAREREKFSPGEWETLKRIPMLLHPGKAVSELRADSIIVLARRIDLALLISAAKRLDEAVDLFRRQMEKHITASSVSGGSTFAVSTSLGVVVIGAAGNDVHSTEAAVTIDFGGDDRYEAAAGAASDLLPVSVCIDLAGDDTYVVGQASGILGIGFLLDVAGDDVYTGDRGSQGCGIGGVGVLVDLAGDDRYVSTSSGQGFGMYGVGLLVDVKGADQYEGHFLMQGASGPGGFGGLLDGGGDDRYFSGGRYPDFREAGAYLSMSQGFSAGIRPLASGGIALLFDGGGDDHYKADYFAQGSSNWGGTGVLIDRSGNDSFTARRYAQGSGTHLAAGLLIDEAGNDRYQLWGVGQGCGHDLSVGILKDISGDDEYRGSFLCQGAGNANGIGVLEDLRGTDTYFAEQDDCRGYGYPSRDYGSIGLFLDRGGVDTYVGPGGEDQVWTGGQYGAGVDLP